MQERCGFGEAAFLPCSLHRLFFKLYYNKKRPTSYFRCSVSFQEICGGSERGECKPDDENCYKCVCKSAYDGTYCEKCPVSGVMTFFSHCYSIIH